MNENETISRYHRSVLRVGLVLEMEKCFLLSWSPLCFRNCLSWFLLRHCAVGLLCFDNSKIISFLGLSEFKASKVSPNSHIQ